jgi:hypothetical protein
MRAEFQAFVQNNTWGLVARPSNSNIVFFARPSNSNIVFGKWIFFGTAVYPAIRPGGHVTFFLNNMALTMMKPSLMSPNQAPFIPFSTLSSLQIGLSINLMFKTPLFMAPSMKWCIPNNLLVLRIPYFTITSAFFNNLSTVSNKHLVRGSIFFTYLQSIGFGLSLSDSSLCIHHSPIEITYLLLYVDGIILTASSSSFLAHIISLLWYEFSTTDLDHLHHFLGIALTRESIGLFLSQCSGSSSWYG